MNPTTKNSHVATLFERQKRTALLNRTSDWKDRRAKLHQLKKWVLEHRDEIHRAEFEDLGKPASEVDITEVYPVLTECRHAISHLKRWTAPEPIDGSLSFLGTSAYVQYEPKGTSLIISPWNYPVLLAVGPMISSIAAGNTIVLKPSEFTPATNRVIREMIESLFPADQVAVLEGDAAMATELLSLPYDHVFFTGSPAVGKVVMNAAAKNLTSVTLELGGKSPTIVDETANITDAARKITWGKWTNAGQTCVAPDYVFVHRSRLQALLDGLRTEVEKRYHERRNYASIINERHHGRLSSLLKDAQERGAHVEFGGSMDTASHFIQPTVLTEVSDEMLLMQEEIFGPLLPLMVFDDLEEVIRYINDRPKPLALYLYSKSRANKEKVLKCTSSGSVVINDGVLQFGHPHLPMGGVGNSGLGKSHGKAGFLVFSHGKAVLKQRVGFTVARTVYPPYSSIKKKLIELMLKYF
ncbi:aldehyde dehydrogenase family protein [Marinoscillum sp.]|uniref:aldehyde dehydrogenase family protein n=1 Tax=Marinoscillum sp. TaxID=2024838 RepID=UPI003BACEDD9